MGRIGVPSQVPFLSCYSFPSVPSVPFLPSFPFKMISICTPKMHQALDMMSSAEMIQLEKAVLDNNDELVIRMLAAKDVSLDMDLRVHLMMQDPLMQILGREDVCWGDLMMLNPVKPAKSECRLIEDWDEDWVMPILSLRKQIWENFPVVVKQIESKAGNTYAVQWHMKNFQEARDACEHGWQYMDFEEDTYCRLMKALNASRNWTVQPAAGAEDLCTIVMNGEEEEKLLEKPLKPFVLPSRQVNDSDSVCSESSQESDGWIEVAKKGPVVPVLRRLNDIKEHFPVVWSEVAGCSSKTYAVELFGRKIKELGLNGTKVKADLLAALKVSKSWTVLPATSDRQACQIRMNHL